MIAISVAKEQPMEVRLRVALSGFVAICCAGVVAAADTRPAAKESSAGDQLVIEQGSVADKYKKLETSLRDLAEKSRRKIPAAPNCCAKRRISARNAT
jgi:hypothetical protein